MRNSLRAVFFGVFIIPVALAVTASGAFAGPTPGSNTYYSWPDRAKLTSVDFVITVRKDPGTQANVFWSSQFDFGNGGTAYTGLQSNGGKPRTFLFSVWHASVARPGSAGSACVPFSENGTGRSCRIHRGWQQGHSYRFHLAHEGNGWFGVTVTDLTTGSSFKLGSIQTNSQTVATTNMINWTEYFEWNFDTATCDNQPYSQAEFAVPVANGGTITSTVDRTDPSSTCMQYTKIDQTPGGSLHTNGLGNSLRMPIHTADGMCLDARGGADEGTPVIAFACTGRENQAWVLGRNGQIALAENMCVRIKGQTRSGAPASLLQCSPTARRWAYNGSALQLLDQALCLTAHGSDVPVTVEQCTASANQQWTVQRP